MEYIKLHECAEYRNERTKQIDYETYITTDNMLPNKGGITIAETLPNSKTISKYIKDDILLSNIRPYFKKIWLSTRTGGCSNDVLVVKAKKGYLPTFLYYVLSDNNFFNYDTTTSKGTKMPRGTPNAIMKYLVPNYPIEKQRRIADILSTYDSLIELNTKRIKTLEQMAENLYKEWFVRFRFPGHEKAEFENGIPKGWEIKRIGEIGKVVGGGTPSTEQSEYWNGDIPWLTPADMKSFDDIYISSGSTFITEEGLKKSSATMLPKDTVLLSSRAPIGYVGIAKNPICTNQGFKNVICNPTNILPEVLFYFFKKNKDLLECYASGSTFLEVSSGRLKKIKLIVPPLNIQQIFVDTISPWIKQTDALSEINNNLIKQRDLLLPRLMSGKLEV